MLKKDSLNQRCTFNTNRLAVKSRKFCVTPPLSELKFAEKILEILTIKVTESLPTDWQDINNVKDAINWMHERELQSIFLVMQLITNNEVIGFIFLDESYSHNNLIDLRLGYLLGESFWGYGYATEVIEGLVGWCEKSKQIRSLKGGIAIDNIASIKVLEKNGFHKITNDQNPIGVVFLERKFNQNE